MLSLDLISSSCQSPLAMPSILIIASLVRSFVRLSTIVAGASPLNMLILNAFAAIPFTQSPPITTIPLAQPPPSFCTHCLPVSLMAIIPFTQFPSITTIPLAQLPPPFVHTVSLSHLWPLSRLLSFLFLCTYCSSASLIAIIPFAQARSF